jgi:hypothetical protein
VASNRKKTRGRSPTKRIESVNEIPQQYRIVCWVYAKGRTRIMCAPRDPRSKMLFPCVFTMEAAT